MPGNGYILDYRALLAIRSRNLESNCSDVQVYISICVYLIFITFVVC